jgi:hypothetical protein
VCCGAFFFGCAGSGKWTTLYTGYNTNYIVSPAVFLYVTEFRVHGFFGGAVTGYTTYSFSDTTTTSEEKSKVD